MRTASGTLTALLASGQFFMADMYTFTLADGTVLKFTSFDQDIGDFVGEVSSGLGWERTTAKWSLGLSVDTMDITLTAEPSTGVIESIASGAWDGATVLVERAFMATPGDLSAGTVIIFPGWIGDITEIGRLKCSMQLQSKLALLNVAMPQGLFQPSCRWVFGSPSCGVDRGPLVQIGTVQAGSTAATIQTGLTQPGPIAAPASAPTLSSHTVTGVNLPPNITYYAVVTYLTTIGETTASAESSLLVTATNGVLRVASPASGTNITGYNVYVGLAPNDEQLQSTTPISIGTNFDMALTGIAQSGIRPPTSSSNGFFSLGTLTLTSGDAAGSTRVVESNSDAGAANLRVPIFSTVAVGDTFEIVPGCAHTMAACQSFGNIARYGGEPFIPFPEQGSL